MDWACIWLIIKFFGGLLILFAFGWLIGHLFKLDKYYDEFYKKRK